MPWVSECWGFAIARDLTTASGQHLTGFLQNQIGFEDDQNAPHSHRSSVQWPFQRYTWTDHGVGQGDRVSYTISPVTKTAAGLSVDTVAAVTIGPVTVTSEGDGKIAGYFNRGILLSQFMASRLGAKWTKSDLVKLKTTLEQDDSDLRRFLMGQLGERLLSLLDQAKTGKWHVYGALYELEDDTLIARLQMLGQKAHLVLSNGSDTKKGSDGNAKAAAALGGVTDLHRRMLWSEGLGHNKFLVFAKSPSQPFLVWTGSTNCAMTGLCTQFNNGIEIEDAGLATVYLKQWKLLRDDRRIGRGGSDMHFGDALMTSNDQPKIGGRGSLGKWTAWFARTSAAQEMEAVTRLINGAQKAILFLMFEPGSNGLLQVIQARLSPASETYQPHLYVHGVVNTIKPTPGEDVHVELVARGTNNPFDLHVVEPEGISGSLGQWAAEVTRRDFLLGQGGVIGHAIIHSKMIVIDPFTNPTVITGSHNFSASASTKNDENLLIVQGNRALAERYAVNIMATYQHYRWRAYLQECAALHKTPWQGLKKADTWQKKYVAHDPELQFWLQH